MMSEILKASWNDERKAKHSETISGQWKDESLAELRERRSTGLKIGQNPDVARAVTTKRWEDPKEAKKFLDGLAKAVAKTAQNTAKHERASERLKLLQQNPEFRAKAEANMAKGRLPGVWTAERRAKAAERGRERMLKQWQDPNYRTKKSEDTANQWKNPEIRIKMIDGKINK
jgi:hypothetical protein